ncbi:MAG: hypothetical protein IKE76_11985 [Clostridia bacterium]|nr:hypothetical protein [Clostridia bacterium]
MGIISMCFGCPNAVSDAKLADPRMTTADNPFAVEKPDPLDALKRHNRRRLVKDAEMRACPVRGQAYSAIMDTRFKGE